MNFLEFFFINLKVLIRFTKFGCNGIHLALQICTIEIGLFGGHGFSDELVAYSQGLASYVGLHRNGVELVYLFLGLRIVVNQPLKHRQYIQGILHFLDCIFGLRISTLKLHASLWWIILFIGAATRIISLIRMIPAHPIGLIWWTSVRVLQGSVVVVGCATIALLPHGALSQIRWLVVILRVGGGAAHCRRSVRIVSH